MQKDYLILRRASASRPSGEWNDDDFDVLANGEVVGRIFKVNAAPVGSPWMWTLAFGYHDDRTPTHGYEPTREAAMQALREELAAGVIRNRFGAVLKRNPLPLIPPVTRVPGASP
jgi:hypothetical protein